MNNGLNRSALNRSMLGSGVASPYSHASASVVCAVVGTCRACLTKYGSALQVISAIGHVTAQQQVAAAIAGLMAVVGTLTPRVLIQRVTSIREYLRAICTADASVRYSGKASQAIATVGAMVVHVYHKKFATAYQVCGINSAASGIALSNEPTSERQIMVPAASRVIYIGVSNDAAGV